MEVDLLNDGNVWLARAIFSWDPAWVRRTTDEDVYTTLSEGAQYYTITVNRLEAGRLGLSVDEIAAALRTQIEGRMIGAALEDGRRTPILIRGSEETRQAPTLRANCP